VGHETKHCPAFATRPESRHALAAFRSSHHPLWMLSNLDIIYEMSIRDFTLERLCAIRKHLLHLRIPTTDGTRTAETRLIRRIAESSLTPSAWLASMAMIRNGAVQTGKVTVISSSTHASIA